MKRIFVILAVVLVLALAACGGHEGAVGSEETAWLSFTGDCRGAMLSLDGGEGILLRPAAYTKKSTKNRWYQVAPGRHSVRISRNGAVIVARDILVGNGQTKEIFVP